jgi:hypothetical protein
MKCGCCNPCSCNVTSLSVDARGATDPQPSTPAPPDELAELRAQIDAEHRRDLVIIVALIVAYLVFREVV